MKHIIEFCDISPAHFLYILYNKEFYKSYFKPTTMFTRKVNLSKNHYGIILVPIFFTCRVSFEKHRYKMS